MSKKQMNIKDDVDYRFDLLEKIEAIKISPEFIRWVIDDKEFFEEIFNTISDLNNKIIEKQSDFYKEESWAWAESERIHQITLENLRKENAIEEIKKDIKEAEKKLAELDE